MISDRAFLALGFVFVVLAILATAAERTSEGEFYFLVGIVCWGFQSVLEQLQKRG